MRPLHLLAATGLAAPLFVAGALVFGPRPDEIATRRELIGRPGDYVGAESCRSCHPDHHASWRATHHSRMTQRPGPQSVVGAFDGRVVRYEEQTARPFRDGARYCIEVPTTDPGGAAHRTAEVALTVGSRRYQQYFERRQRGSSTEYVRLPILWHVERQRWLHLNTVFLGPDNPDWHASAAVWNENCIFCHNVGPAPHASGAFGARDAAIAFDSKVADLGIACEACHGPGGAHVRRFANPLARYARQLGGESDAAGGDSICDPADLDRERSVSVCGQCHGARLPSPFERIDEWFSTGPTYRPGERLLEHVEPITPATPVHGDGDPELFRLRFWRDGTPRLTAYELQGVLASPCYRDGEMTCLSCHAMHAGDPDGQLRPDRPGNALCLQCHTEIGRDVGAHTHHDPGGTGSNCVDCHMPRIVFGVLEIHRSHRIESPDPARDAAASRPHACTLCHTDRTLPWAATELRRLWGGDRWPDPTARADGAPIAVPDAIASLHAGDAAVRAVYAAALGRATTAPPPAATAVQRLHLAAAMGDGYPSVRWLAQRSLAQLEARAPLGIDAALARIDSMAGPEARRAAVFGTLDAIAARAPGRLLPPPPGALVGGDFRLDGAAVIRLMDLQGRNVIAIGE